MVLIPLDKRSERVLKFVFTEKKIAAESDISYLQYQTGAVQAILKRLYGPQPQYFTNGDFS